MGNIEGLEGTTVRAMNYPAIGLAQALTPEVQRKVKGFTEGIIYTTEFKEDDTRERVPLGEKVELIVYKVYPGVPRAKYNSRDDDDLPMFDCMSIDGKQGSKYGDCVGCKYADFENDKEDRCYTQGVAVVAPRNQLDNFKRLIFQKSNFNTGEKLKRLFAAESRKQKFNSVFELPIILSTKLVENKQRKAFYYVFDVKAGEKIGDTPEMAQIRENYELVKEQYDIMYEQFYANIESAKSAKIQEDTAEGECVDANATAAAAIEALSSLASNKQESQDAIL